MLDRLLPSANVLIGHLGRINSFAYSSGIVAGYYQENFDNNAYVIIGHMVGNLMGIIGTIVMNANS